MDMGGSYCPMGHGWPAFKAIDLLSTVNEWCYYCPTCDKRFNKNGEWHPEERAMLSERAIQGILNEVKYKDWRLYLGRENDRLYLQCVYNAPDVGIGLARKWFLSPLMERGQIIQTAFLAVMIAEEHETREAFTYRGRAVFGPHFDIDKLWELCGPGYEVKDNEDPDPFPVSFP